MSPLHALRQQGARLARVQRTPIASAQFHARAALRAGGESNLHHEDRAEKLEQKKQEQLREQKEGKGEWKAELSSDSEAHIKADRDPAPPSKENIQKLQQESADHVQKKHGQK